MALTKARLLKAQFPRSRKIPKISSQILAMWILALKLPSSDLNFAMDYWVDFSSCFFQGERPEKITKNPPQNSPGTLFRKIPLN